MSFFRRLLPRPVRAVPIAAALTCALAASLVAAPSYAEVPEGWSDPAPVDGVRAVLVLGGIPLGLFLLITLLVMAPSLTRNARSAESADEWFGGPRAAELPAASPADSPAGSAETGGASGRW